MLHAWETYMQWLEASIHAKDAVIYVVICSSTAKSCLQQSSKSSDFPLRQAKCNKFTKYLRNIKSLKLSATRRFIPLAMNKLGRRGQHFDAILLEMVSLLILRPSRCRMLQGPFAHPPIVALAKSSPRGVRD